MTSPLARAVRHPEPHRITVRPESSAARLGEMAQSGHPDFVGVADARPSITAVPLVASPGTTVLLAVGLVLVGSILLVSGPVGPGPRRRRWRARLEGAPPAVL
jgi:hypothetical protein